jgi:nitrogen fixation protein NifU and related proteins
MSEKLDDFVKDLQNEINEDAVKAYGQKGFERWRNPLYMKLMGNPDGYGCITGPCGDTMKIFLKFEKGKVKEASFQTDGCGSSMICGSFAAELALGKKPNELQNITKETILETIGGLPAEEQHCALLAANTLHQAIDSYLHGTGTKDNNAGG